jgi:hypothetical protein
MTTLSGLINGNQLTERITFGDSVRTELAKQKILVSRFTSANVHSTPREIGASSGYLVPSGKKYVVTGLRLIFSGAGGGGNVGLVTATSDVGVFANSAPSGPDSGTPANIMISPAANGKYELPFLMVVPAGKYLYGYLDPGTGSTGFMTIIGHEINIEATEL